jgi:autotransporter-associated beta strand protein
LAHFLARRSSAYGNAERLVRAAGGWAHRLQFIGFVVIASIAAVSAQAQNATWDGTGNGNWSTGTNWSPSTPPNTVPTGTATFATTGVGAITLATAVLIDTIQINTGSSNYSFNLSNLSGPTLTLNSANGGIVDNSAGTISFANGIIAGPGGVQQLGTGTLILSGADTYSGETAVTAGTLQVDGSIADSAALNVGSNGTLSGIGTLPATTISRGTLAPGTPGNPTGTLTVNGNLVLSSVADYLVNFNGSNVTNSNVPNSTTNVTGSATVAGTFTAAAMGPAGSYSAADTYVVLSAAQGVSRTFTYLNASGSFGNLVPYLSYPTNAQNNVTNVVMGLTAGTAWLGGSPAGGPYDWDTTANWAGGTVPTATGVTNEPAATMAASTVATFGGSAPPLPPLITVNSAATANTLLFTSSAPSPFQFGINEGGSLVLNGIGIANNSSYPPQFAVGSSTGAGGGTLQFTAAATAGNAAITNYSGGTTTFGVATVNAVDTATAGTAIIINNSDGATNFYGATTAASASITTNNQGTTTFNGSSTGGAATITTTTGGTTTFNGNSTGGNAIFIANSGGIVDFADSSGPLSNPNNVSAGAIEETDGLTGGAIQLGANTLTITAGVPATSFAGVISGNGGLTIAGGTTTLAGTNTYSGATAINGGTLAVTGSIATSSAVAVNSGGTLSGNGTVPGVTVNAGGTLAPGAPTGTLTINGNLALASGAYYEAAINGSSNGTAAVTGAANKATVNGIFTAIADGGPYSTTPYTVLTTANASGVSGTFSGLTMSGTFGNQVPYLIQIQNSNSVEMGLTGGVIWTGPSGGIWRTGSNWTGGAAPGAGTSATSVAAFDTAAATTVNVTGAPQVGTMLLYSGAGPFTFTINSGTSLALNGIGIVDNSSNPPQFTVGGTLQFQNAATAGDAVITTNNGGTTEFSGNSTGGTAQFTTTGTGVVNFSGTTGPSGNGNITAGAIEGNGEIILGANTLTVTAPAGTFTGTLGAAGDSGGFTVGGGTQVLSGATGNYTGATTIGSGANLTLTKTGATPTTLASGVVVDNGTLDISGNGSTSIAGLSGTNTGASVALGANTLTITNGSTTFSGAIGGAGGLMVSGGVQTLAGVSTYTGATTISGGILNLTGTNSIAASSAATIDAGGTLGLGENAQTINSIALNGGTIEGGLLAGTINSTGGTINGVGGNATVTASSGTTIFAGTNTYAPTFSVPGSGITTVSSGATISGGAANAFSASSPVTDNGTLDLGSQNQQIASLSGAGTVTSQTNPNATAAGSTAVLTVGTAGVATTFSGAIENGQTGTAAAGVLTGLELTGGLLTLSGTSTYTGATTVDGGILSVTGNISSSSGVTVNAGGILPGGVTAPSFLSGTGTVPAVTVNAGGTLAPGTFVNPIGTLNISGNLTLASGADYAVTITSTNGSNGSAAVTGTASLGGIFTAVPGAGAYSANDTYTVLSTATSNGVSGTFSGINISNTPGNNFGNVVPYLIYNSNNVELGLTAGTVWSGTASSNWNTGGNWSGGSVPSAGTTAASVATFTNNSAPTSVSINTSATAGTMLFTSTAPAYTFAVNSGNSLTLSGIGIDDNSSNTQTFCVGSAVGIGTCTVSSGYGTLQFQNAASVANNSAGGVVIIATGNGGLTEFSNNSTGGTAQFSTTAGGVVDFSGSLGANSNGSISAGSIAGAGNFYLGANQLNIIGNNLSTTVGPATPGGVGGIISDCGAGNQCNGNANGRTGGVLVMNGIGSTLTLTGANIYTGGTILTAGTLNVGANTNYVTAATPSSGILNSAIGTGTLTFNGGTLQAGDTNFSSDHTGFFIANAAQVTSSGGTIDANGQIFTLAGNIGDNALSIGGTLNIVDSSAGGGGTVVFSGANTYSGATFVGNGSENVTLLAGAPGAFSPNSAVTVTADATLNLGGFAQSVAAVALNAGGTIENGALSGPITSTGGTINGLGGGATVTASSGTTTLSILAGANTYTGATTINAGAILTGNAASAFSAASAVTDNGKLDLGTNNQTINALNGTGFVGSFSGSNAGPAILTVSNGGSFAGTIEDGTTGAATALTVAGGTLTLSGTNSYSGATTVNGGNLSVTGQINLSSSVTVNSGGTLSGTGTIVPNVTVANGGTLAPGSSGNPIRTLTINGNPANTNLTMNSGANYVATITGSAANDTSLTSVTGGAALAGTLTLAGSGGSTSQTYVILSAGSLGGTTFSGVNVTGNFGNDLPSVSYTGTAVDLNLIVGTVWRGVAGPTASDWNTATNWQGGVVPAAVAAFDNTAVNTAVSISAPTAVDTLLFNANAPAFTFTINSGGSLTLNTDGIVNESTATTPTFTVAGTLEFAGSATAANAIINTSSGGLTEFSVNSTGGNAQFNTSAGGVVDFSDSTGPAGNKVLSAGSIAGAGNYYLGANQLTVGGNNLSTTVSGVISDCGTGGTLCQASRATGGSLNKVGTGTLTLSGINTYTGGTTITAGIVQAMNNSSVGSGAVTLNGGTFQAGSSFSFGNAFTVNASGGTIDTQGKTLTLTGAMTGAFAGTLNIASSSGIGTLQLDDGGSISLSGGLANLNVNSAVIFSGIGSVTVPNVNILSGGTLAPGSTSNPTGTLNINGNLTLSSAAAYLVTINGSNNTNSLTNVSGTATLNGATLAASATSTGISLTQSYTVLTAKGGGITGTGTGAFTTPVFNAQGVGLVQADVTYTGTAATATFQHAQLNAGNLSSGFASFVNAINAASANNTLPAAFQNLFNLPAGSQQAAAQQLSGLTNSGGPTAVALMQTGFTSKLVDRGNMSASGDGFGVYGQALSFAPPVAQSPEVQAGYDAVTPHDPLDALMRSLNPEYNNTVWASAYGGYSKMTGQSAIGSPTTTTGGGGIASGIDFRFGSGTMLGFALGGGGTGWGLADGVGGGTSEIFQAGIYGSQRFGNAYVAGALAFAYDWMQINRNVTLPTAGNLTASFSAPGATARLETGYHFGNKDFDVAPYVAGEFSALRTPAYTESGSPAAFALSYAAETPLNARAEFGVWAGKAFTLQDESLLWLRGRVGYAHDWWTDNSFNANFVELPTQSFSMTGITPPANIGLASLMSELRYRNGVSLGLQLDVELASASYSVAGTGTFRYSW